MRLNLKMDSFALNQQSKHGIMDDDEKKEVDHVEVSSSSSQVSSVLSSEEDSDLFDGEEEEEEEEVNSCASNSTSTSPTSDLSSSSSGVSGPLQDMSSLFQDLPFKRGLSKHYNGKSQSFTSLANVRCLEDLAKPENPYNKKLKSCKSYGGLFQSYHAGRSNTHHSNTSRLISKKSSRGSCSSLCVKRNSSFTGNRPPMPPPHRATSTSNFTPQAPLFALGV